MIIFEASNYTYWICLPNETMAEGNQQMLSCYLAAKIILELQAFFSETRESISVQFHMKHPLDEAILI